MSRADALVPTVSIVTPVYNAAGSIGETLGSIFEQTRTDFEVLVVDDGSQDTAALDAALRPWGARIRFFRQVNLGAGAARNLALTRALGRYVAFLDADDRWMPEFLERQVAVLDGRPECDMVWSDGWIAGDTPLAGRRFFATTHCVAQPSFRTLVEQTCTVLTSSVVAKRSAVNAVGRFDAQLRRGQDFDLWLRMAFRGVVMEARSEPLVWRRVHGDNLSGDAATELRRAITVLEGIPAKLPLDACELDLVHRRLATLRAQVELELGKRALRAGDIAGAKAHLSRTAAIGNWKLRAVSIAARVAPDLLRRVYLRSRPVGSQ